MPGETISLADIHKGIKDVKEQQQGFVTSLEAVQKEWKETQAKLETESQKVADEHKAWQEKMADIGVFGYGDNADKAKAKFERAYSWTDFLKKVDSFENKTPLPGKEKCVFSVRPYPEAHFEKVMEAEISETGGHTVPDFMQNELIERLKSQQVLRQAGVRSITVPANFGSFKVPVLASGVTFSEIGEIATTTVTTPNVDLLTASPKRVSGGVEMSNALIRMNAVDLDDAIVTDAVEDLGLRVDFLGLKGSGAAFQPRGIITTPNIGSVVAGDPDGGPVTVDLLIDLQKTIAAANSHERSTAYIAHSSIWHEILKITEGAAPGFHIFPSVQFQPGIAVKPAKQVIGAPLFTFNELPINLTKGSGTDLGEIFYGDWTDLRQVIWGAMEVRTSREATHPVTGRSAFFNNITHFLFEMETDYYVRHAGSFAVSTDVETL